MPCGINVSMDILGERACCYVCLQFIEASDYYVLS